MADFERQQMIQIGGATVYTSKWHSYWYEVNGVEIDIRDVAQMIGAECPVIKKIEDITSGFCRIRGRHLEVLKELLEHFTVDQMLAYQEQKQKDFLQSLSSRAGEAVEHPF